MAYIGNSPGVASQRVETAFTATSNQTAFTPSSGYTLGYCDVYQNGVKLVNGDDYTASDGATVTLATGAASGDSIVIVASFPRGLSDGYLKSEADAKYVALTGAQTVAGVKTFSSQIVGIAGTAGAPAVTTTGDTDTGIFFPAANTIAFSTNGTEDARFDASGNLGLGATPSAWSANRPTLEFGGSVQSTIAFNGSVTNGGAIWTNAYYNGTNNIYKQTGPASLFATPNGTFEFNTAPSGTAGASATFTQAMLLNNSGNLGLGVTPSAWSQGKAVEVGYVGNSIWSPGGNEVIISQGAYYNGGWKYSGSSAGAVSYYTQITGIHKWFNAPSGSAGAAATFTQAMTLDASGKLLVGLTSGAGFVSNLVVSRYAVTSSPIFSWTNATTNSGHCHVFSSGAGITVDGALSLGSGEGGAGTFTERFRIDASGNCMIGDYFGVSNHRINKATGQGNTVLVVSSFPGTSVNADIALFYSITTGGASSSGTALVLGKNGGTSRSINAAGTVNQSGADYAEYMHKASDFTVAKGDVVGINAEGKITNVFADAVSFCVKSTDPGLVGGDKWFTEQRPRDENNNELTTDTQEYIEWEARMEAARALVDRIAFCGQVPVNVTGATPGQYIVPVNDNGAIKGEAVSNPTFEQYQQAVGKVIAIEQDGRARIIVKVA